MVSDVLLLTLFQILLVNIRLQLVVVVEHSLLQDQVKVVRMESGNPVFSTITSQGGGGAGGGDNSTGQNGGSDGGAGASDNAGSGGTGNKRETVLILHHLKEIMVVVAPLAVLLLPEEVAAAVVLVVPVVHLVLVESVYQQIFLVSLLSMQVVVVPRLRVENLREEMVAVVTV